MQTEEGRFGLRTGSTSLADLPYGFLLYPGAQLIDSTAIRAKEQEDIGRSLRFRTRDSIAKVAAFYRDQAELARLVLSTDRQIGPFAVLAGAYPDGRDGGFQLTLRPAPGGGTEASLQSGFGLDVTGNAPVSPANATAPNL
jgi:hypothetical protein